MTASVPDLRAIHTLPELLAWRAAQTPETEAYRHFDPVAGQWTSLSWAQTRERVACWSRALAASNLPLGARVAILLPNGLDAMSIDQAVLATAVTLQRQGLRQADGLSQAAAPGGIDEG